LIPEEIQNLFRYLFIKEIILSKMILLIVINIHHLIETNFNKTRKMEKCSKIKSAEDDVKHSKQRIQFEIDEYYF
jgi:hypothetical protein